MTDDPRYRSPRPDPSSRDRTFRSASPPQDDPLAELARLIGQDQAFIAASREGARARHRDPQPEPENATSAPNWLARTGQRSDTGGTGSYEGQTGRRDAGYPDDFELEGGRRARQEPARWDAGPGEDDTRYRGPEQEAG